MEAIKAGARVRRLLIEATASPQPALQPLIEAARASGIAVVRVPPAQLAAIHPRHQGVAVDVGEFQYATMGELLDSVRAAGPTALVLALDQIQDPQNLGTLLRTALAVNAAGVIIPEHRGAGVTPAVSRASAGAVEHLVIAQVPNLGRALDQLKSAGLWVAGLEVHGGTPIDEADLSGPLAIVVGSEGSGLGRLVGEKCDLLVHLPMAGPTESLNAAVAGSIVLYDAFRRRQRAARE
jgi:23S rRNA (guanosine2251-2'-O)-methyltransferase